MTLVDERRHPGRIPLIAWERAKPDDFYSANPWLPRVLNRFAPSTWRERERELIAFGRQAAGPIDAAARENDDRLNHPRLERYDGVGVRTEGIRFHPSYHAAGRPAYDAGIVACMREPGNTWFQATLFYLLCHNGEAGHACPITCTAGLVRAIQQKGDEALKARWLPGLLVADYDAKLHGSQFLTEVQTGSDVGSNIVEAVPDPEIPGAWRISGEKWFCSVADASLFLVVARPRGAPDGTKGLGCFLVPRHLEDGRPNGFTLRRLKEKIGTRTMASGEIDFDGALAWPIGPLEEGFKTAVGIVLNTSRLMNALGSAGAMQRAYYEAAAFAAHRRAFGQTIGAYPLVRETLARMKAESAAALASTFLLVQLVDRMDQGSASDADRRYHRLLVNANKYWTSIRATAIVRDGIEILGGNGTIETFSVLPRLWRDSIVMESWEGAHNVLVMQVLRDAAKLDLLPVVADRVAAYVATGREVDAPTADRVWAAWERLLPVLERCVAEPSYGALHMRRGLDRLMQLLQVGILLELAAGEEVHRGLVAAADFLARWWLDPAWAPETDADYPARIDAVLGDDLERFAERGAAVYRELGAEG